MVHHFNEQNRRDLGVVWLIIGLVFLFSGFSGGLVFLALGGAWLATSMGSGLERFREKPERMQSILKRLTIAFLALAVVLLSINAVR